MRYRPVEDNFSRYRRRAAQGGERFRWLRLLRHIGQAGVARQAPRQYQRPARRPPGFLPDGQLSPGDPDDGAQA